MTSTPVDTDPLRRAPSAPVRRHDAFEGVRVLVSVLLATAGPALGMALLRRVDAQRRRRGREAHLMSSGDASGP